MQAAKAGEPALESTYFKPALESTYLNRGMSVRPYRGPRRLIWRFLEW